MSLIQLSDTLSLDSIISPKSITVNQILQYVRAKQNSLGNSVTTLYRLVNEIIPAYGAGFNKPDDTVHSFIPDRRNIFIFKYSFLLFIFFLRRNISFNDICKSRRIIGRKIVAESSADFAHYRKIGTDDRHALYHGLDS